MTTLVFIDTNIFLDFYRLESREAGLSILEKIEQNTELIITGDQIAMEFKKNRQKVIIDVHKSMRAPDWATLQLPPVLGESKASKALARHKAEVKNTAERLKKRLEKVLGSPSAYDPVYRVVSSLSKADGPYNLSRKKTIRADIRELAQKRFLLGYPPRKVADTSIGDAINWEWLVHCAKTAGAHIVIATRDYDYGPSVGGQPILNDWLREEFKARVGRKRKLILTDRLSVAFKEASIAVSKQEKQAEDALIAAQPAGSSPPRLIDKLNAYWDTRERDTWEALLLNQLRQRQLPVSEGPAADQAPE